MWAVRCEPSPGPIAMRYHSGRAKRRPLLQFSIKRMLASIALLTIFMAWGLELSRRSGLHFDFNDYQVLTDEPLVNPTEFFGLEGNRVDLGAGHYLVVEATTWAYEDYPAVQWSPVIQEHLSEGLENELARMGRSTKPGIVDLQAAPDGRVFLYVRHQPWACGTRVGTHIHIPMFRRRVYLNRRLLIGIGRIKTEEPATYLKADPGRTDSGG